MRTVLIAGIGGGSLGLIIFRCLRYAGRYRLIGTDISPRAYGLYEEGFDKTYLLRSSKDNDYIQELIDICRKEKVDALAPGSEAGHRIISENREVFQKEGILPMVNSKEVINLCLDKAKLFEFLKLNKVKVPETRVVINEKDVREFKSFPCIVKPSSSRGGSAFVFIAEDEEEAVFFSRYLSRRGFTPLLQEYLADPEEEYSVSVLSVPSGEIIGSVAMKRLHDPKFSYILKYRNMLISSGYHQGLVDYFPEVQKQCENIAKVLNSRWALNIQGRLINGNFYPFEINPRFSGSAIIRALAGFNEPDILLQYCLEGKLIVPKEIKIGYYLRTITEKYVPLHALKTYEYMDCKRGEKSWRIN
jgi:carbamoyl-phosphate synthase large subunit